MKANERSLIIAFVADLIFGDKIARAAESLECDTRFITRLEDLTDVVDYGPQRQLAEHLEGPGAALMDQLTRPRPGLLVFDLGNKSIPWKSWVALVKSAPATRRIAVLCYGGHLATADLRAAHDAGADVVVTRGRFSQHMLRLLAENLQRTDGQGVEDACSQNLPEEAIAGLQAFNRGDYYQAHEHLEAAWLAEQGVGRELYRAILQIAVAYYQIKRGNYRGALKMFLRARQWIDPLPPHCQGVDVARLRDDADTVYAELTRLGQAGLGDFNVQSLPPISYSIA